MEALEPGDPPQIGAYRLLRRLGAGGMGTVYLGRTVGGRTVAVKVVHSEFAADPEFRVRFRQEVAAARAVGSRWTAPVLDADTDDARPWVATGYVAGPTLGQAVREFGPLPAAAVRTLGEGLTDALAAVHGLGLVHRDVKPSNVLLALDGPRLIDFGIARAMDAATALTRSGFVVGSPGFMSPEQAQGLIVGPASDVFSLGAVLAYAATGVAPFGEGVSAAVLLYRVLNEPPQLGDLDGELRRLILDCLAKEPGDRPTPRQLHKYLTTGGTGTIRLGQAGWLPPAVSDSVARLAVELLALDSAVLPTVEEAPLAGAPVPAAGDGWATPPGAFGPPPTFGPSAALIPQPGAWPPPAPTLPTLPPEPSGPRASGRRALLVVGAAVLAAAAAGVTFWLNSGAGIAHGDGGPARSAGPGRSSAATASPTSAPPTTAATSQPPAGIIPAEFLGTWQGAPLQTSGTTTISLVYRIQFVQGKVGETVGHSTTAAPAEGVVCSTTDVLVSATARTVVVSEALTHSSPGCDATPPEEVTFSLNTSGTLQITQKGYSSAELTQQP